MTKKFSFRAVEIEAKFLNGEAKKTNTNITAVIKKLIRNAMEGKEREDQIEVLEAKLERLKETLERFTALSVENATFAKHVTLAIYNILVHEDEEKMDEMKKVCDELIEKEMEGIQE